MEEANTGFLPRHQHVWGELYKLYKYRPGRYVQVNPNAGIIGACQVHCITRERNVNGFIKKNHLLSLITINTGFGEFKYINSNIHRTKM